jgi:hypothetical protein
MSDIEPIVQYQLTRNVKAFLEAKGENFDPTRRPEYLIEGATLLKKTFGSDLAAYMCRQDNTTRFKRWCRGTDLPANYESQGLVYAIEIAQILLGKLTPRRAKEWMTTPCQYLMNELPLDFVVEDPELVRRAALQLFL